MFCWQARALFADWLEAEGRGWPSSRREVFQAHRLSCERCRVELERLGRVSILIAEASGRGVLRDGSPGAELAFEQRVLREARARTNAARPEKARLVLRPLPVGAALSLMLAAVAASLFLGGSGSPIERTHHVARAQLASPAQESADSVVAPQEIPLLVQEDLVGERRATMPITTYVLEPAPVEAPVMRASL